LETLLGGPKNTWEPRGAPENRGNTGGWEKQKGFPNFGEGHRGALEGAQYSPEEGAKRVSGEKHTGG